MSGLPMAGSFLATLLLSIFLALGMSSLLYWANDRALTPWIIAHRLGIIRAAALGYLAVLYLVQAMQYNVDPHMWVFGGYWAFLNLMLISLYVLVIRVGDRATMWVHVLACAVYLNVYAQPLSLAVVSIFAVWVLLLLVLAHFRTQIQQNRWWDYGGLAALGLVGVLGIYVTMPRIFDGWWWLREVTALLIVGVINGEYIRLTATADAKTAQLQRVAMYDQLTKDAVLARDQSDLADLLTQAQHDNTSLIVAAIDVDHFGAINQSHGYLAGNIVLVAVVDRVQHVLKASGQKVRLYRSGGEEFTLGFAGIEATQAAAIVAQCLAAVRAKAFDIDGQAVALTLSAGLSASRQEDASIDDVYKRADDNLRLSKKHGRDRMFGAGVAETAATTPKPAKLRYFAQPIEAVREDAVEQWGAELLLREYDADNDKWHLPASFDLSVEKQIALITHVLHHSPLRCVTINLTIQEFSDVNTAHALAGFASADYGPENLIVEIVTVPDLATIRRVTAVYRGAGIRIFIDDVGSDNSYELVQQILPYIDGVKFAMQNLRKHESLARVRERVSFWISVAAKQHIGFILEGVEDESDVAFAQTQHVEYFQGYYFGKPAMP